MKPRYYSAMNPVFPCRELTTRHCPASFDAVCGDRPCQRYEDNDYNTWAPELLNTTGEVIIELHPDNPLGVWKGE